MRYVEPSSAVNATVADAGGVDATATDVSAPRLEPLYTSMTGTKVVPNPTLRAAEKVNEPSAGAVHSYQIE